MSELKSLDYSIRGIISWLFRIILVLYGLSIIIRNINYFEWPVYLTGFIIYLIIFNILYHKEGVWSLLRLLNDFIFFALILYQKDLNDFHASTLVILPIINSLNHSSKKSPRVFSIQLYLLTIILMYFLRGYIFYLRDLIALLSFASINFLLYLRTYILDFNTELNGIVEDFYGEKLSLGKSYHLLNRVKERLVNHGRPAIFLHPTLIACFKFSKNLPIVSSTEFLTSFTVKDDHFFGKVEKHSILINVNTEVNGNEANENIYVLVRVREVEYLYFIRHEKNFIPLFLNLYVDTIIVPLLKKISFVIDIENELRQERKKYLHKMKAKIQFVESTVKGIHYLNNKLSPISNYFALQKLYAKMSDIDPKKIPLKDIIDKEYETARKNITPIIEKTRRILKKPYNPYIVSEVEDIDLYKVFGIVRNLWNEQGLDNNCLKIIWNAEYLKNEIQVGEESLEYVLDEIITNLSKHYKENYEVRFFIDHETPVIMFINDIKDESAKVQVKKIISDFHDDTAMELVKRNSHGLYFIKQFLIQMAINVHLKQEYDYFILKLSFKLKK